MTDTIPLTTCSPIAANIPPARLQAAHEAVAAWLTDMTINAGELQGLPYKLLTPAFRLNPAANEWQSSWGYNVALAEVDADEFDQVLTDIRAHTVAGQWSVRKLQGGYVRIGCFIITLQQALDLLTATREWQASGGDLSVASIP